jgi:hypothetical protein
LSPNGQCDLKQDGVFNKIVSMDNPRVIQMEVKSLNSDIVEVDFVDDSGRSASDLVCESMVLRQASIPETDDFVLASSVPLETIPVDGTRYTSIIYKLYFITVTIYF